MCATYSVTDTRFSQLETNTRDGHIHILGITDAEVKVWGAAEVIPFMDKLLHSLLKLPDNVQLSIERVYPIPRRRNNSLATPLSTKIWIVHFSD